MCILYGSRVTLIFAKWFHDRSYENTAIRHKYELSCFLCHENVILKKLYLGSRIDLLFQLEKLIASAFSFCGWSGIPSWSGIILKVLRQYSVHLVYLHLFVSILFSNAFVCRHLLISKFMFKHPVHNANKKYLWKDIRHRLNRRVS